MIILQKTRSRSTAEYPAVHYSTVQYQYNNNNSLELCFFFFQIQGQQNKHIYSVNSGWSNEGLSVWLGPPPLLPSFSSLKGKPRRTLAESDNRVIRSFRAFVCSHTSNSTHYSAVSTTSRSLLCGFLSSPLKCTPSHWLGIEFGENIAAQGADCST